VDVKIGGADFVHLIDGPVVGQRFELNSVPNQSSMVLIVHDDSVLLNQVEQVELFEDQQPHDIARALFEQFGLTAEVDSVDGASGGLTRYVVQRGTAMHLLRELARRHGMFAYVRPGDEPGNSIGVFQRPVKGGDEYPELLIMGKDRNVNSFRAEFDALRPATAQANSIDITDKTVLSSESDVASTDPLGDIPVHDVLSAGKLLLARTREDTSDLDAATAAAVDISSWAYAADAEVSAEVYRGVLLPHKVVTVAGAGGFLSGDYLIDRVSHVINSESYKQQFSLRRNARAAGSNTNGLSPGVF
jgi:phage protein D